MSSNRIAIVGASSQIARDLICSFLGQQKTHLLLYVRNTSDAVLWLQKHGLDKTKCTVHDYSEYGKKAHDVVINFVGVGDPRRAAEMGAEIFDITLKFDELALAYLQKNPNCRYIFLSSGAVYGASYNRAIDSRTLASFDVNNILPQDYYAIAKFHAEARHRSLDNLFIMDVRVFNYFSRTQDLSARFFITDIVRSIKGQTIFETTNDNIVRDYIHPQDFSQLISRLIESDPCNTAVDCYTREPVDKKQILETMEQMFGLQYAIKNRASEIVNATGMKPFYYSLNKVAGLYGYDPKYTSLECIVSETSAILDVY